MSYTTKADVRALGRAACLAARCAVLAFAASSASGADVVWQGGDAANPVDWNTAANWDTGAVPGAGDSVTIPSGAADMPVLAASTPVLGSVTISGTLTMTNWTTCLNATTVTIPSGGILTCGAAVTNAADLSRVWVNCADLAIASEGRIDVNDKGYAGHPAAAYRAGYGPGGSYVTKDGYSAGPSHGGHGGRRLNCNYMLPIILPYDNPASPELPGSGGASSQWSAGKNGGGVVKIEATGAVVVDGAILADGANASAHGAVSSAASWSATGTQDSHDQSGSGGSINISCRTFSGSGTLSAKGGGGVWPFSNIPSYSAGGGMIAVHYDADAEETASVEGMTITADAGRYTRYLKGKTDAYVSSNVDDKYDDHGVNAGMGTLHFTDAQIVRQLAGKTLTGNVLGVSSFVHDGDWSFTGGRVAFGEEGVKVTVNGNLVFSGDDSRLEIGGGVTTNWDSHVVLYAGTTPSELTVTGDLTLGGVSRLDIRAAATNGIDRFGARVKVGGTMTISTNCFVYSWSDCQNLGSPHFEVGSLDVQTGGVFSAVGRGGRGSYHAATTSFGNSMGGRGPGAANRATIGASHGGTGGNGKGTTAPAAYDDELRPCMPGSGGSSYGNQWAQSGAGGGLIYVTATNGTIRVDGTIDVSGRGGTYFSDGNGYGGGGSGGTIFLEAKKFFGGATGRLRADGGDTKPKDNIASGTGAGGRIAVWCGKPWEPGLSPSRFTASATPIADCPKAMSYLGSYSASAGPKVGDYGTDDNIGEDGTVRFCYAPSGQGFVVLFR